MASGTIMVVEDDALIAAHVESVLAATGYTVLPPLAFGEEAVEAITDRPPDLILMDIQLAGEMDGIDAASQIQALHDVPVVYLTAYIQDERLERARATTPYGYLTKPVSGYELLATIDTVLYRHALDRRLRESEARYRNLVDNVPGAVYRCEAEPPRRAVFLSDAVLAISGRPAAEFLAGDTLWTDLIVAEDLANTDRAVAAALNEGAPYSLEYRIRHADSSLRWVYDGGRFVRDMPGAPMHMDGIILDVTERKRLEAERDSALQALRASETRYRTLVENIPGVVCIADFTPPWPVQYMSEEALALTGRPAEDFLAGRVHWGDIVLPEDLPNLVQTVASAVARRRPFTLEYRIRHADGNLRWVKDVGRIVYDADGNPQRLDGVNLDITPRKRLEAERDAAVRALSQREAYLTAIIDNLPGVVWLKDREGRFLALNRAHAVPSGLDTLEHVVGKTDHDILPREQAERYQAEDAAVMESGRPLRVEEQIVDRGEIKWIEKYKTPIRDADGAIIGTTGYSHDISGLKRAAEERAAKELVEAEKTSSLSVLAGHMAHELNNLLQAIVGELDLVLSGAATDAGARMRIESALQAAGRANALMRQRLTYRSAGEVHIDQVVLDRLVDENRRLFDAAVGPRAALHAVGADGVPPLCADAGLLRLALLHLITNAAEAIGDAPGHVTLSAVVADCDAACLGRSRLTAKPPAGRYVSVEVTDTGCGMDAATVQRMVEPGFTTKSAGHGVGMSVVMAVMQAHGGAILVDSRPGHGTTVRLLFPASAPVIQTPPPLLVAHEARPGTRWLVAEGDADVRRVTAESLARLGHDVLLAATADEAMHIVQARGTEIAGVLLDVALPGMGGSATCAALRRMRPDLPVILTSGHAEAEATARCGGQAALVLLQKPWRMETLAAALRSALCTEP